MRSFSLSNSALKKNSWKGCGFPTCWYALGVRHERYAHGHTFLLFINTLDTERRKSFPRFTTLLRTSHHGLPENEVTAATKTKRIDPPDFDCKTLCTLQGMLWRSCRYESVPQTLIQEHCATTIGGTAVMKALFLRSTSKMALWAIRRLFSQTDLL